MADLPDTIHVYVDAAHDRRTRIVNSYGKKVVDKLAQWRIGVVCGEHRRSFVNAKVDGQDSYVAEAFALIKGLEVAAEIAPDATTIVIHSDSIPEWQSRNRQATMYMGVLRREADKRGIVLQLEPIAGADNPADAVSRGGGDDYRGERPAETPAPSASGDDFLAGMAARDARRKAAKKIVWADPALKAELARLVLRARPGTKKAQAADEAARAFIAKLGIAGMEVHDLQELQSRARASMA